MLFSSSFALIIIVQLLFFIVVLPNSTVDRKTSTVEMAPTMTVICPKNQTFDDHTGRCCTVCNEGFGVSLPCTEQNDTECDPCALVNGRITYSAIADHKSSCETCSLCPNHAVPIHWCNTTHNTKCQCESDYYARTHLLPNGDIQFSCRKCIICSAGQHLQFACEHGRDTRCRRCPKGHFSTGSNWTACRRCQQCPTTTVNSCTDSTDTVCSAPSTDHRIFLGDGSELIPIYCSLLGSIIVGLIIYVLLKRWHPTKRSVKSTDPLLTSVPPVSMVHSHTNFDGDARRKLSDLCISKLATELTVGKSVDNVPLWMIVATQLGYDDQSNTSAQTVLNLWNRDGSNLLNLIRALKHVNRLDLMTDIVCKGTDPKIAVNL